MATPVTAIPRPLPPDALLEELIQQAGDQSARAYAMTEKKSPVAAAKSYVDFRNTAKTVFVPIIRRMMGDY